MRTPQQSPFLDPEEDDLDDWVEAHSANISRVDLVGASANGSKFLLLKSDESGFVSPEDIRSLITKSEMESTVTPKKFTYHRGERVVTSARALTNGELATALRKAKGNVVAVYDETGHLVGTVDESKIVPTKSATAADAPAPAPVAAPKPPAPAPQPPLPGDAPAAPIVQPDATDGPVAQAAEEVKKALQGQRFSGGTQAFAKSAGGSVDGRYVALVKSLAPGAQDALQDAVARAAMRFQFAQGTPGTEAVRLAKSVALDLAAAESRKPRPSIESAAAAMRSVLAHRPTVR
jgi:hypothetical protein